MKTNQATNDSELYTSTETRKKLGISASTLKNLTEKGIIEKVVPVGYAHGYYTKSSVDAYYEQKQLFHRTYLSKQEDNPDQQGIVGPEKEVDGNQPNDKEASKPMFKVATVEDTEGIYELSQRAISKNTMDAEVRRAWLTKNAEQNFVVKHNNKVVAFFHLLPVKSERLKLFMDGKIRGWDIRAEDVETFEPGKPVECLAIIASEQEVDDAMREHYVLMLIRGIMRKLEELGRRGVIITKVYATSETPTGIAMSLHAQMNELDIRLGKRLAFVMDVETTNARILKSYKKGLAEWKKDQSKQTKKRAS